MWSSTVLVMAENIPITEKFSPEQLDLEEDIEGGLEKITLDLNELSDEEKYSQTMPEKHKCDGCMAIAYTLHTSLQIKHLKNKHIKQYRIPESQLLELFDDTCSEEGPLGQYGISADTGDNRLKGPGIYQAPGASHMGGRMTYRLASMCEAYREADELWIYEIWLSGELDGLRQLSDFLCFNSHYKGEEDDLNLNLCGGGKFPNTHREKLDNYKEEHDNPPEQREDIMDIAKEKGLEEDWKDKVEVEKEEL